MSFFFPCKLDGVIKLTKKYINLVRRSKKWKKNIFYLQRKNAKLHKEIHSLWQQLYSYQTEPTAVFMTKLLANMESTRYHLKEGNSTMLIKDFEIRDNLLKEAKDRGWL